MNTSKGRSFNCAERTLMQIHEANPSPLFGPTVMKVASNFGSGVSGLGSICGALRGAAMALGLFYRTDGSEPEEEFKKRRAELRSMSKGFMLDFEKEFGSMNCIYLLGIDRRTEEGMRLFEERRMKGLLPYSDYISWTVNK